MGAGRKPKWDFWFKLRVGQACEVLWRIEVQKVVSEQKAKLISDETDLNDIWGQADKIPLHDRKRWLESEAGERHIYDFKEEVAAFSDNSNETVSANLLVRIRSKPTRGTRKRIIETIAEKFELEHNQVDNFWQFYRRFEVSEK